MTTKTNLKPIDGLPATKGLEDLLYQLLETELGGVQVYRAALQAAENTELAEEWEKYLTETEEHVSIARELLQGLGLDPDVETPARKVVRNTAETLVKNIAEAIAAGDPAAAQLTAAEAVVEAETKDQMNWHLVGTLAKRAKGETGKLLTDAYERVESQEDHHYYHTKGWARELWLQALGLPCVLPPPEEVKNVETAIGAARAEKARGPSARQQPRSSD
jgi:rubrerythrin